MSLQGNCRPAVCASGKLIDVSGKCVSALEEVRGLAYKIFVVFVPGKLQMVTPEDIQSLSNYIHRSIAEVSPQSMSDINITVLNHVSQEGYAELQRITLFSHFIANDTIKRDKYEDILLLLFSRTWTVPRANGTENEIEVNPVIFGEKLKEFEQSKNEDIDFIIELPMTGKQTHQMLKSQEFSINGSFTTPQVAAVKTSTYRQTHATNIQHPFLWDFKHIFIDVTHSLTCPYVPVNISNITTAKDKLPKMTFLLKGTAVSVSSKKKVTVVEDQLQLCISVYKKLTGPTMSRNKQSLLERVQYYIEAICVSLSMVCLLFSGLTYCVFPSLRSLPGMNNLSLCVSLAVAQTCLLITARLGVNSLLPQVYCLMHAVLLHYSWLAAFAWMSVCCIHMFRVFTANSNKFTDNRSDKKRYLHYCIYGFGVPALIVIATYATNATVSSGMSSGYNNDICFLDTRRSIWTLVLSLLAPLCLVIITNSFMFVMTVRQIVHVSNLQENSRSRDRQGVLTYVKLSTLTGLLGAVVVVAVQLNSPVLSLLTSPLMALQGVFIFVSFTCNQRVRRLYVDLFGRLGLPCVKSTERTTSTGSTALRTSSNKPG